MCVVRRGTRKRKKEKRNEKSKKTKKKKKSEVDYQRKGMTDVELLKTRLLFLLIIHLLFTDGWRIEKMTVENDNLTRSFVLRKDKYETKCTPTIDPV